MSEISPIDTLWVTITAILVIAMAPAFLLVEAGFVQAKSVANVVLKNIVDFCAGALAYWAIGFGIAFGGTSPFIGLKFFAPDALPNEWGSVHPFAFLMFQFAFAAVAATIVSGAMAGRTKIFAYFAYTVLITALVYPVVSHWAWGGGWLSRIGFMDFAGSTVVHSVGGWAGLMGALFLGRRLGKVPGKAIPAHNLTFAAVGMFLLLVGWMGFNPGSALAFTDDGMTTALKAAVNTLLAAGAGGIGALFLMYFHTKKWDLGFTINGAIGGLVAITAPSGFVDPRMAVIIGFIAAPVVVYSFRAMDRAGLDDPVGAVSVHAWAGVWGTLSVGLFDPSVGLFFGGGLHQLGVQAVGIAAVAGWTMALCGALFAAFRFSPFGNKLRVSPEEEKYGIDIAEHGSWAYDFSNGDEEQVERFGIPVPSRPQP